MRMAVLGIAAIASVASLAAAVPSIDVWAKVPLVMPPSWMPDDWDRNVFPGNAANLDAGNRRNFQQDMLQITPLTLWAVANYNGAPAESYGLTMIWAAAVRSCERGGQMVDDLSGEFGDRNRGRAAIAQSQKDLKAWAATQPKEMTLYFTAKLGQWNQNTGAFPLQEARMATTIRPKLIERDGFVWNGANIELGNDQNGPTINHFQSSLTEPACLSRDGRTLYKFPRLSQWWIVFGDAYIGFGGIPAWRSREYMPPVKLSREAAAALAQRNPQRKVEVAVTFVPAGTSYNDGRNQYYVRAKFKKVEVTDALTDAVLVSKTY